MHKRRRRADFESSFLLKDAKEDLHDVRLKA